MRHGPHLRAGPPALALVAACLVLFAGERAHAEPRFALRQGVNCDACHLNHTGGGMRTEYGVSFSQSDLPTTRLKAFANPFLWKFAALGADIRLVNHSRLVAKTELGENRWETTPSNTFEMPEAQIYLRVDPIPSHLSVYVDETIGPEGASAREAFVQLHGGPAGLYVKAGRFMLPYGLRVPDDVSFFRQQTGFTYANQDIGFEVGISPRPISASIAVSNGTDGGLDLNLSKRITATVSAVAPFLRGGGSFSFNDTSGEGFVFRTYTFGGHVGARLGRLVGFFEFDWIRGTTDERPYDQYALYAEVDFEAWKGLWLRFMFEGYDPLLSLAENERDRFVFALSWFPIQFLELRATYRLNRDIPQRPDGNADELLFEIHGFL